MAKLALHADERTLRERSKGTPESSPDNPPILYIALDGVGRDILYGLLRAGKLPNFAALLGAEGGKFPHAHFEERMVSTLPSSTMAAWMTTMTGVGPATHGVTGNEYFVREDRSFACPAPVSFVSAVPTLEIFTEGYLDKLGSSPTVYERMREKDPNVLVWVGMHVVYRGADKLLLAGKTVLAKAFQGFIQKEVEQRVQDKESRRVYSELDEGIVDRVVSALETGPLPDVLTVYLAGTDLYAHIATEGPDAARTKYLVEVVDPAMGKLRKTLEKRKALAGRFVVVSSDHGHTQVLHDETHALATEKDEGVRAVLKRTGFRVRPYARHVPEKEPFSAVVAHGGAMAYVYLADRAKCPAETDVCDWNQPPRYEEDVLVAAQAFYKNNEDGSIVPPMRGVLDVVLVRKPKPFGQVDLPFEVYVGAGKTTPVEQYFKEHPHPTYVHVDARLRDLAVGERGERAGDILLLAHNGDKDEPGDRYYFAELFHSWHGSPSKGDSDIPFIVASSAHDSAAIGAYVGRVLGQKPFQQKVADVLLGLRLGALREAPK